MNRLEMWLFKRLLKKYREEEAAKETYWEWRARALKEFGITEDR